MTSANDMKGMLLAVSADLARKAIRAIHETDLMSGYCEEKVLVGDVEWEVTAFYWQDSGHVKIMAKPIGGEAEIPSGLAALFGPASTVGGEQLDYTLPAEWVPVEAINEV